MLECRFVPLESFPVPETKKRRRATFGAPWSRTLDDLERELRHLGARDIVIQIRVGYEDIRNDGWPRSTARPSSPAVVLSFSTKNGPLSFPCDTYQFWEHNVRAIALGLAALRVVERYGITRRAEQYHGWRQISASTGSGEFQTPSEAAAWCIAVAQSQVEVAQILVPGEVRTAVFRECARVCHPDTGGTAERFEQFTRARRLVERATR